MLNNGITAFAEKSTRKGRFDTLVIEWTNVEHARAFALAWDTRRPSEYHGTIAVRDF